MTNEDIYCAVMNIVNEPFNATLVVVTVQNNATVLVLDICFRLTFSLSQIANLISSNYMVPTTINKCLKSRSNYSNIFYQLPIDT